MGWKLCLHRIRWLPTIAIAVEVQDWQHWHQWHHTLNIGIEAILAHYFSPIALLQWESNTTDSVWRLTDNKTTIALLWFTSNVCFTFLSLSLLYIALNWVIAWIAQTVNCFELNSQYFWTHFIQFYLFIINILIINFNQVLIHLKYCALVYQCIQYISEFVNQ